MLPPVLVVRSACCRAAALCAVLLGCAPPAEPPGDLAPPADLQGPDGAAGETVIRVHYPAGARALSLRGDAAPLSWERGVPMRRLDAEVAEVRLAGLGGPFEFKPLLDDQVWSRGVNYRARPGETVEVFPSFVAAQGRWARRWPSVPSKLLNNQRGVWAYLPPSYDENPLKRYPVLYMHDGQNLFDPMSAFGGVTWRVAETLDRGIGALDPGESIPEVIVIGPENASAARLYEYTPTEGGMGGGGGDLYLRFLIEELKPRVDAELRTRPEGAATALAGSSLGGLISAYAGLRHPEAFGRIGALSPSTWWDNSYLIGAVGQSGAPRAARIYVDSGDSGPSRDDVDNTRRLAQTYRQVGYRDGVDLLYVVQAGAEHNEAYWAQRLPAALRFLLAGL